jgi:hypothetical protein
MVKMLIREIGNLLRNVFGMFIIALLVIPVDLLILLLYEPTPEWYAAQSETVEAFAPEIIAGGRWMIREIERMLMGV